eukprot:1193239-Prorocentrum_minimum.AAC.2
MSDSLTRPLPRLSQVPAGVVEDTAGNLNAASDPLVVTVNLLSACHSLPAGSKSGVYPLVLAADGGSGGQFPVEEQGGPRKQFGVFCDMDLMGGGWTLIAKAKVVMIV